MSFNIPTRFNARLLFWSLLPFTVSVANAQDTGIRLGSFLLVPQIDLSETYSDNIFLDNSAEETEDFVTVLGGQVRLESDWSRHALAVFGSLDVARFAKTSEENTEEYGAGAAARLDLLRGATLSLNASYDRLAERRDNAENVTRITQIDAYDATATLNYRPNRLGFRLRGDIQRRDFRDPQEEDRNRNDYGVSTRLSYETAPGFSVFSEPFVTIRDFDNTQQDGTDQDSLIYGSLFGVEVDLGATLTGEFGAGAFREEFAQDDRDTLSSLALDGALSWRPTRLTRITGEIARRSQATQTAGGKIRTQARLTLRQEVRRDLTVSAVVDYFREDFEGVSRVDDTHRGEFELTYDIRDRVSLFSGYEYRQRVSDESDRSFRSHTATIGLRAGF